MFGLLGVFVFVWALLTFFPEEVQPTVASECDYATLEDDDVYCCEECASLYIDERL